MGGPAARVWGLGKNLLEATLIHAKVLANEILRTIESADGTPFDRLWGQPRAMAWFKKNSATVPHNYPNKWLDERKREYEQEIAQVLKECVEDYYTPTCPKIPEGWWNGCFHESLKGVSGATFCGTDPDDATGVKRDQELTFGGVVVIAAIAYAKARCSFDKFQPTFEEPAIGHGGAHAIPPHPGSRPHQAGRQPTLVVLHEGLWRAGAWER